MAKERSRVATNRDVANAARAIVLMVFGVPGFVYGVLNSSFIGVGLGLLAWCAGGYLINRVEAE